MKLFYRRYGEKGNQPIIILHGLFGISDNWVSYARRMAKVGFDVFVIDQRNHGQSPQSNNFNYPVLTSDLFNFIDEHEIDNPIIIGHSMGGKVAMRFALENPHTVKKLVVVDIAQKAYDLPETHLKIIKVMNSVDFSIVNSRKDVEKLLKPVILEISIRQFILKNLYRIEKNKYKWRIYLEGIESNIELISDYVGTTTTFEKPTLFIRGGASNYILDEDYPLIKTNFPNAKITTIEGASHWVHVEAMEKFYQLTMQFAKAVL